MLSITGQQAGDLQLRTTEQLTSAATETDQPETGRSPPAAMGHSVEKLDSKFLPKKRRPREGGYAAILLNNDV